MKRIDAIKILKRHFRWSNYRPLVLQEVPEYAEDAPDIFYVTVDDIEIMRKDAKAALNALFDSVGRLKALCCMADIKEVRK